ncbi:N-acetyltransferase family protein [Rhodobacteraceae bacterium 2376]|uniref:N-acetyltransferase family protein n=1 Tax=Rhabdonatronobacter sediminivivens TaxID=2743469 RepID=A0A7Z0I2F9_9RHOB|nr:GNAT family N-acetyltransferase [Rhabdonatronobacter sediminivivens]NYS26590.1 N-acetyltransferase family protein [Rhabdonatronobacter sediminivivens]
MIRAARPDDAGAIIGLWNPVIRDTVITFNPVEKTEKDVDALIAEATARDWGFLVAEEGGHVQGFARYFQFRGGPGYARSMEHTVYLDPLAHGRGLGHALMEALESHARARGMRMLIGGITGSNAASLRFHAARGYAEVGRIPDAGFKFGTYHPLVLVQKRL